MQSQHIAAATLLIGGVASCPSQSLPQPALPEGALADGFAAEHPSTGTAEISAVNVAC
jgi:hypothetical protein